MTLAELYLNRYLYRDNLQVLTTPDPAFVSADSSSAASPAVPAGGAAQDINTGNVTINGQQLTPGTYPVTVLDVSNWGWGQTCPFYPSNIDTVTWGSGSFTSADGTSYTISPGTTGAMSVKTYIYLSLLDSITAYQTTTIPGDSVGIGKVLVAVANPSAVVGTNATYNLSQATQIVGDNILANTIDASKITTGQLIVGTNVGLGTAQTASQVTTIVGNTITTDYVNALNVTAAGIVTGNLIQTSASSNTGVKMSDAVGGIAVFGQSTLNFITTGGLAAGFIGANTSQQLVVYNQYGTVYIGTSAVGITIGAAVYVNNNILPTLDASYSLGSSSYAWINVFSYNYGFNGGAYLNYTGGFIQSNSQFRVVGTINLTGNMVFENYASFSIKDSGGTARVMYATTGAYDSTKYYLRS